MANRDESEASAKPELALHEFTINQLVDGGVETKCMRCGRVVGRWRHSTEGTLCGEGINVTCVQKLAEQPTVIEDYPGRAEFHCGETLTREHSRTLIAYFRLLEEAVGLLETAAERIDLAHSGRAVPPWGPLLAAMREFLENGGKHPQVWVFPETGVTVSWKQEGQP